MELKEFKYQTTGEIPIKQTLENYICILLNIRETRSITTRSQLDIIWNNIKDKKIRPFTNYSSHNYNYHSDIIFIKHNIHSYFIKNAITVDKYGKEFTGNQINWTELYIYEDNTNTVESYENKLKTNKDSIKKNKDAIEILEKENTEISGLITHMKENNIKELDFEEFLMHKKLVESEL